MIHCIYRGKYAGSSAEMGKQLGGEDTEADCGGRSLQLGDPLEIAVAADGVVQMHRVGEIPSLAQLVAQITRRIACGDFTRAGDRKGSRRMVSPYVPDTGDIVFLDFDPQVGRNRPSAGRLWS